MSYIYVKVHGVRISLICTLKGLIRTVKEVKKKLPVLINRISSAVQSTMLLHLVNHDGREPINSHKTTHYWKTTSRALHGPVASQRWLPAWFSAT